MCFLLVVITLKCNYKNKTISNLVCVCVVVFDSTQLTSYNSSRKITFYLKGIIIQMIYSIIYKKKKKTLTIYIYFSKNNFLWKQRYQDFIIF